MIKKLFNILLSIVIALSFTLLMRIKTEAINDIEPNSYGNWYFDYESKLDESYYDALSGISNKDDFKETLHEIISTGTTVIPYSNSNHNGDCYDALTEIDKDLRASDNEDYIYCILTGKMMPGRAGFGSAGSNTWNREHIWAKKYGFKDASSSAPYCDLNHLRAADFSANSAMHNDKQYNVVLNPTKTDEYGNKVDSNFYEPRDAAKGDIARMIMYMATRYTGDELSEGYDLTIVEEYYGTELQENWSVSDQNGYMSTLSVLLRWHQEDPVDDFERKRNDLVFEWQGNRNPYIDHPEYANMVFGTTYNDGYTVSYYPLDGNFNYFDNHLYQYGDKVNAPTYEPTPKVGYQFAGWYLDKEYNKAFDFANDSVSGNISLYAKYDFVGYTIQEAFDSKRVENAMHFSYTLEEGEGTPKELKSEILFTNQNHDYYQPTTAMSPIDTSNENFSNYITYDTSLFDITYFYKGTSGYYGYNNEVGSGVIKLYAKTSGNSYIEINVKKNADIKITGYDIDYDYTTGTKYNTKANLPENGILIEQDDSRLFVKNNISSNSGNVIWVKKVSIKYVSTKAESAFSYQYNDVQMLYRFDLSEYQEMFEDKELGFIVNGRYTEAKVVDGIAYLTIDALDFDIVYSVEPYYKDGSGIHVQTSEYLNSYSVNTLAKKYYKDYYDLIVDYELAIINLMGD